MTDGQSEASRDNPLRPPTPNPQTDRRVEKISDLDTWRMVEKQRDHVFGQLEAKARQDFINYASAQNSALGALSILTRMAAGETIPQAPAPEVLFGALLQSAAQLLELARKRLERSDHAQADKTT